MLEQLSIKNVAVIDRLEVVFKDGMTVLTGETGAGKSIIIDSINMILGSRANKELVRRGAARAEVQAVFSVTEPVRALLEENDIDAEEDSVIISRRLTAEGKSTARVNGTVVTLSMLREIADMLINIHGQHDNQALLDPSKHIGFLDGYAHTAELISAYRIPYDRARAASRRLRALRTDEQERMRRADLLSYQINEINAAELEEGEEEELLAQRRLLENAEKINMNTETAYELLYEAPEGASAYDMISRAAEAVSEIKDVCPELGEAYDAVVSAMVTVEEAARDIHSFGGSVEFDRESLDIVEERLELINRLKRKYGGTVTEIKEFGKKAAEELNDIETGDEQCAQLSDELKRLKPELERAAAELTKRRSSAAAELEKAIETALHELNMEKAVFRIRLMTQKYGIDGADTAEFMIATNPGEEPKPLVRIASGGELSRVMLAIKSVLAGSDGVGTLIFDEIDTGVSGSAAQRIADKLKTIGENRQVICISHLPQLAAAADNHFLIVKDTAGELASTTLHELDHEGRVEELARIVGGGGAGEEYAREMLKEK